MVSSLPSVLTECRNQTKSVTSPCVAVLLRARRSIADGARAVDTFLCCFFPSASAAKYGNFSATTASGATGRWVSNHHRKYFKFLSLTVPPAHLGRLRCLKAHSREITLSASYWVMKLHNRHVVVFVDMWRIKWVNKFRATYITDTIT